MYSLAVSTSPSNSSWVRFEFEAGLLRRAVGGAVGDRGAQARFQHVEPGARRPLFAVQSVRNKEQAVPHVVKGYQCVGQQEDPIGQGRRMEHPIQFWLEESHGLVTQIAHQPANKARQAAGQLRPVPVGGGRGEAGQFGLQVT